MTPTESPILSAIEQWLNRTPTGAPLTPKARYGALQWGVSAEFYPWTVWLGIHVDPRVVRSGDEGIEAGWDIEFLLPFVDIQLRLYRVRTYYAVGEAFMDTVVRDSEAHP